MRRGFVDLGLCFMNGEGIAQVALAHDSINAFHDARVSLRMSGDDVQSECNALFPLKRCGGELILKEINGQEGVVASGY